LSFPQGICVLLVPELHEKDLIRASLAVKFQSIIVYLTAHCEAGDAKQQHSWRSDGLLPSGSPDLKNALTAPAKCSNKGKELGGP
jgi:hypothetical protein